MQPVPSRYNHNNHNGNHILHGVMGSSRVTKSIPHSQSRQAARYNNRIKAALAVQPSRQPGMQPYTDHGYRSDSSSSYTSQPPCDYHSPSPSTPVPLPVQAAIPTPMLYGVKCTEVSQKAYSGQTSEMKSGFERLQRLDSGKVEYRTIAFCTHLTVSRWEAATSVASTGSSEESASAASPTASSRNNPNHAAQLMSLANYIRHILSLTAGNPIAQPPQANANNQPQKQETTPKPTNNNHAQELHTSTSRPLKALSNRRHRHRYSPDYHDHAGQRHARHQDQQYSDYPTDNQQQPMIRPESSFQGPYDQGYREGNNDHYDHHSAPQHIHGQQQPHQHRYSQQHQYQHDQYDQSYPAVHHRSESPSNSAKSSSDSFRHFPQPINTSRNLPQLPKVPFPNLTLTLALIYVDRLKAKNPDAKGEQGCSHRLFLIAFIIAAKYRCSVALSPPLHPHESESENSLYYDPPVVPEEDNEEQQSLESRLNSELIFSNHAWVRLLNLGSFARTPATPTSAASGNTGNGRGQTLPISSSAGGQHQHQQQALSPYMSSSVPPSPQVSEISTMTSNTSVPTTPTQGQTPTQAQTQPQLQSLSSIMHSVTQNSSSSSSLANAAGSVLQVEDLDRMEAEFLTFLNFDLATMSHDLETCWNLLVGEKDV
ncbi:hypothetical protein BGZ88_004117 [Linnemannia elongata]|nr:hypothetical protein BGZ88_004117 [Linnemannia elongata]